MSFAKVLVIVVWAAAIFSAVRLFVVLSRNGNRRREFEYLRVSGPLMTIFCALTAPIYIDLPKFTYIPEMFFWLFVAFPVMTWAMFGAAVSMYSIFDRL